MSAGEIAQPLRASAATTTTTMTTTWKTPIHGLKS